jgi:hypothetical protein
MPTLVVTQRTSDWVHCDDRSLTTHEPPARKQIMKRLILALCLIVVIGLTLAAGYAAGRGNLSMNLIQRQLAASVEWLSPTDSNPAPPKINDDYGFQLTHSEIKQGDGVTITVRLLHKATGEPVPNAVVFASRLDMSPDGMANMTAPVEPIGEVETGTYRFTTDIMMEGGWQLSLAAKVQGEPGTVRNQFLLKAVP